MGCKCGGWLVVRQGASRASRLTAKRSSTETHRHQDTQPQRHTPKQGHTITRMQTNTRTHVHTQTRGWADTQTQIQTHKHTSHRPTDTDIRIGDLISRLGPRSDLRASGPGLETRPKALFPVPDPGVRSRASPGARPCTRSRVLVSRPGLEVLPRRLVPQ